MKNKTKEKIKRIMYVSPKEMIEVSYPRWADIVMRFLWKHLKVKTVKKVSNGTKITRVFLVEYANLI
jgi:hypothetical protein